MNDYEFQEILYLQSEIEKIRVEREHLQRTDSILADREQSLMRELEKLHKERYMK